MNNVTRFLLAIFEMDEENLRRVIYYGFYKSSYVYPNILVPYYGEIYILSLQTTTMTHVEHGYNAPNAA